MEGKKGSKSEGRELPCGKSFSTAALVFYFCVQITPALGATEGRILRELPSFPATPSHPQDMFIMDSAPVIRLRYKVGFTKGRLSSGSNLIP